MEPIGSQAGARRSAFGVRPYNENVSPRKNGNAANVGGLTLIEALLIVFILLVIGTVLYPILRASRPLPYRSGCLSHIKQLGLSLMIYTNDYDDRYPVATAWMDRIDEYQKSKDCFHDVEGIPEGGYGYAFRLNASNKKTTSIDFEARYVVLFDSTIGGKNANSELWSLPKPGRHNRSDSLGFADGHAKSVKNLAEDHGTLSTILAEDGKERLTEASASKVTK